MDQLNDNRWRERHAVATLLRIISFLVPFGTSFLAANMFASLLRRPQGFAELALWWVSVVGVSLTSWGLAERMARRIMPLAALFQFSLAFPDKAPSRFKIARTAGKISNIHEQIRSLSEPGMRDAGRAAEIILSLVAKLSLHDTKTRGHSERTRVYTDLIAEEMGLGRGDRDRLRWAALLHDIGKLQVSGEILNKDGPPTDEEWVALRQHPTHGSRLILALVPWLGEWALAVEHHHEKVNGSGYPHGLVGEQISLAGRIVAVADAYETMTARRPYKAPMSVQAARQELVASAGIHFDPAVVRAFLTVSLGRGRWLSGILASVMQAPLVHGASQVLQHVAPAARTLGLGLAVVGGAAAVAAPPPRAPVSARPARSVEARALAAEPIPSPTATVSPKEKPSKDKKPPSGHEDPDKPPRDEVTTGDDEDPSPSPSPSPTPTPKPTPKPPPSPPLAVNDNAWTKDDTVVKIDVAADDWDPDADLVRATATPITAPTAGTAVANGDGTITYTPSSAESKIDTFTYSICDASGLCGTALVTVQIGGAIPPIATRDWTAANDDDVISIPVLANDWAEDGLDPSRLSLVSVPHGPLGKTSVRWNGTIRYEAPDNYSGTDVFVYRVCDSAGVCDDGLVRVSVGPRSKPAAAPDAAWTKHDAAVTISVLANDRDLNDTLDVASLKVIEAPSAGSATVTSSGGKITFTPPSGEWTRIRFRYRICNESERCHEAWVTVHAIPS